MKPNTIIFPVLVCLLLAGRVEAQASLFEMQEWTGLASPLGLTHAGDGSGRIFIVEQGQIDGHNRRVRVVDSEGNLLLAPFIDLGSRTAVGSERGLLDIAFHPEFASNGRFYLHYTAGSNPPAGTSLGDTIVAEFFASGGTSSGVDPEPVKIILTVTQDFANHNGGQMKFGLDGYLYIALGDGGSGGDPCRRAQTIAPDDLVDPGHCGSSAALDDSLALLGKILRIDVDASTTAGDNNLCGADNVGSANYAIPTDNPFFRSELNIDEPRCAEIWHYGLRNPWRFSFDRLTGDLWIGDVGQNQWEEINFLEAPIPVGKNFGWDCYEASSSFEPANCSDDTELQLPVIEYDHSSTGGCSVTGGYVYRGPAAGLQGRYMYGDFCSGDIWLGEKQGDVWTNSLFASGFGALRSFGEDEAGNVYVISASSVFRIEGPAELLFADGFEN